MPEANFTSVYDELPDWLKQALLSPLNLFQTYRLFLIFILLASYFNKSGPPWLGYFSPDLFITSALSYLGFIITSIILCFSGRSTKPGNIQFIILSDIVFITLMMHASGGITTGMGLMLAISVTAGSLLMQGRMSLLFASMATLAILTEQFSQYFFLAHSPANLFQSALLGTAFFAIALLSHSLGLNLRKSQQTALIAQNALNDMASINENIIEQMAAGVIAVHPDGDVILANHKAQKLLNRQTTGNNLSIADIAPPVSRFFNEFMSTRRHKWDISEPLKNTDATQEFHLTFLKLQPLDADSKILIFLEDVSEIKKQAQQLKLASVGRLTASIAHEIRNPLSAINYAGQLLEESSDISRTDNRLTGIITSNVSRLNNIIENVLQISRQQQPHKQTTDIHIWLKTQLQRLKETFQLSDSQLQLEDELNNINISIDPMQLEQIFNILIANAKNHFDRDLSEIKIILSTAVNDENIEISCTDNGPGISADDRQHIFEPFFTTKHTGTGLGLHVAREFTEFNNGQMSFTPALHSGSCFKLTFPVITTMRDHTHD